MEIYKYKKTIGTDVFATRISSIIDKENYIKELFVDYSKIFIIISDKEEFLDIEWTNKDFWTYSLRNYSPAFIGTSEEFKELKKFNKKRENNIIIYLNIEDNRLVNLLEKYRTFSHQEVIYSSLTDVGDKLLLKVIDNALVENTTRMFINLPKEKIEIVRNSEHEKNIFEISSFDDYISLIDHFHDLYQERLSDNKKEKIIIYSSGLNLEYKFDPVAGAIYERRYKDSLIKIEEIKRFGHKSNMIWCEV